MAPGTWCTKGMGGFTIDIDAWTLWFCARIVCEVFDRSRHGLEIGSRALRVNVECVCSVVYFVPLSTFLEAQVII